MKTINCVFALLLISTHGVAQTNVGINESLPTAKLEIKGSGTSSATTALLIKNSSSALILKVRDDGNIGLGYGTPAYRLDVQGRMRIRSNTGQANNSAGIWLDDYRDNSNAAFIGMMDSIRVGFWGEKGAGWQWNYDTKTGNVGMGMIAATGSQRLSIDHPDGASLALYNNGAFRGGMFASDSTLEIYGSSSSILCFPSPCVTPPAKDLILQPDCPTGYLCLYKRGRVGIFVNKPKTDLHISGNVLIGAATADMPTGYKMAIDGKVICEELKVQISQSWPDYVFEPTYPMPTISQLEKKVMEDKHLPNIPSAADVAGNNGIAVGEMQNKLLEKVEELYRYVFQLNNENISMKAELKQLKENKK